MRVSRSLRGQRKKLQVRLATARSVVNPGSLNYGQRVFLNRIEGNLITQAQIPTNEHSILRQQIESRLIGARAESTWSGLTGVWKQFLAYIQLNFPEQDDIPPYEVGVMMFIEAKMLSKTIRVQSAYQYVKRLMQMLTRMAVPYDIQTLLEYKRALKRDGALLPKSQAEPANPEDIAAAMELLTEPEALGLLVAWLTASRIGEMEHLTINCLENVDSDLWIVTFPYTKGDPFRLGSATPFRAGRFHERLKNSTRRTPEAQWTPLKTSRAEAVVGRVREGLTAHSVKRGALLQLLRQGVPLHVIQMIAKHKDLETLLIYLPRGEVAYALGIHDATQKLLF